MTLTFGGDLPVVLPASELTRWIETLEWAVSGCSDEQLRKLFHDSAVEGYRLS